MKGVKMAKRIEDEEEYEDEDYEEEPEDDDLEE
jgi:hypothetical protein